MKAKSTVVILSAVAFFFSLSFVTPRAQAQGGIPLWTNFYNGPTNSYSHAKAVAVDGSDNLFVRGWSRPTINGTNSDFVTIKYSSVNPPAPSLAIGRPMTNTVMVSWPSASPGFVLQQNTNGLGSVNWSNVTETIQNIGTNKFIILNPPVGNCFYRLVNP